MNNKDFIAELAKRTNYTQQNTQQMALAVIEQLLTKVEAEQVIQVPAFGTFEVKKRLERVLVNPNSGKRMMIPPKLVLNFKPVTTLKEEVKKGGEGNE